MSSGFVKFVYLHANDRRNVKQHSGSNNHAAYKKSPLFMHHHPIFIIHLLAWMDCHPSSVHVVADVVAWL
jgi:hypothetical protein